MPGNNAMNQIRILHVVTNMNRGGLETMLMNYYRNIDRDKIQFDFLTHRDYVSHYDEEITSTLGGNIFHVSRLIPWSKKYRSELKQFFLNHPEYRVVHVHQDCLSSVALKCAMDCGVPVRIAHSHSSSAVKNLKYPVKLFYKREIPKYATHLFACGENAGNWMFGDHQYSIIRNAIDLQKYSFSIERQKKVKNVLGLDNNLVIGHVGNFLPAKNHEFIIDIFSAACHIDSNVRLLLVGSGDGMQRIVNKAEHLGIKDKVIFLGSRNDVNELMQAMDVFVFPSIYEGLPLTMIEEQTAGIPSVISDCVPPECIVTSGLVEVKSLNDSAEEWAKSILEKAKLHKHNHDIEISRAGYNIHEEAKKLEKFYLDVFNDARRIE